MRASLYEVRWIDLLDSMSTVNEKYGTLLGVLRDAPERFVPWELLSFLKSIYLPMNLQNMLHHRDCLFLDARRSND